MAIFGVYERFSGEAKIINFSRGRFFLFGPGRARREQPNAGLHLGVRAFVRSVSHVKVLVASLFGLFESLFTYPALPRSGVYTYLYSAVRPDTPREPSGKVRATRDGASQGGVV